MFWICKVQRKLEIYENEFLKARKDFLWAFLFAHSQYLHHK